MKGLGQERLHAFSTLKHLELVPGAVVKRGEQMLGGSSLVGDVAGLLHSVAEERGQFGALGLCQQWEALRQQPQRAVKKRVGAAVARHPGELDLDAGGRLAARERVIGAVDHLYRRADAHPQLLREPLEQEVLEHALLLFGEVLVVALNLLVQSVNS